MSERKIVRGLKPVLIEGTNGEFDHCFWLLRMSLEEAIEAFWACRQDGQYLHGSEVPYRVEIKTGPIADFVQSQDQSVDGEVFLSETANPEWCFASTLHQGPRIDRLGIYPKFFSNYIHRSVEIIEIKYRPTTSDTELLFQHRDYRKRTLVMDRWIVRTESGLETFDSTDGRSIAPGDPGFSGRGVKKLDHDKLYDLCGLSGLDLRNPKFLQGRFVIQNYKR